MMLGAVLLGFRYWGLLGTGVGLLVTGLIDILVINLFARIRYHYRVSATVIRFAVYQLPIGIAVYVVTCMFEGWWYWLSGILLGLLSLSLSFKLLRETH